MRSGEASSRPTQVGRLRPRSARSSISSLIAQAAYAEIDGAGHLPCVEAPARYAEILNAFLKEVGHV